MDEIEANTGRLVDKIDRWVDGFFALIPNFIVAILLLVAFWFIAHGLGSVVRRSAIRRDRENLGEVAASLVRWLVMIVAFMLAVTVIAPSITPADLFGFLGIGSVAIGFAFKDILQNLLAGILILIRQPFHVGDQIISGGHEGTVERIETRATLIRTYDGRRVVIPNSSIYTDAVVVLTAFDMRRSEHDVEIGTSDDWDEAARVMIEAAEGCEGVLADPAPEAFGVAISENGKTLRLRWWTKPRRADVIATQGKVIRAVHRKLVEAGVDMPYPTRVLLLHDQTEESDGDRTRQREGWPVGRDGKAPRPARVVAGNGRGPDRGRP